MAKKKAQPEEIASEILREVRDSVRSNQSTNKNLKEAKQRDLARTKELAFLGDEDAFVALMKLREPKISAQELSRRILLFRELKRIRSSGV